MAVREILLIGNPKLYEVSEEFTRNELPSLKPIVESLHNTMMNFRKATGIGRAIAAPQIGIMKRIIYMNITEPVVMINPVISEKSSEMMEVWDDCMSIPNILVKTKRHKRVRIEFKDGDWNDRVIEAADDLSELLQHEYDHLDGILMFSRAIDDRSIAYSTQKHHLK